MLKIKNLETQINGKKILKGLNLEVRAGEVHAIMGPNGSGKSTLSKVIAGHPGYEVLGGTVEFEVNGTLKNILDMSPEERAREGVFMAFQYPTEVPGVSNLTFLHAAFNAICKHQGAPEMNAEKFRKYVEKKAQEVKISASFLDRNVNEGFSGGEKKKNEILQMAVLAPRLAVLDETDSGLDIDALKTVADGVNSLRGTDKGIVLITHYQRLLDLIEPDYVHVLVNGQIVKTGNKDLAVELESKGYNLYV